MDDFFIAFALFVFGLIVGSFLNVCIVRLPHEQSIVHPRSHCVHCQKMIPRYDNVPVLSYIFLTGRCRFCKKPISLRYMIVELTTGMMFLVLYRTFRMDWVLLPYLVMVCGFIVATFVDFEHRIIPDEVSVGGMVVGIIFSLLIPALHLANSEMDHGFKSNVLSLGRSLIGVLVGGGSIYAIGVLGDIIFKKESMGGGDVKLMAMMGAFMGWKLTLLAFFIAPFFGAVYGIVEKIRTKDSAIAYGPFLVIGAIISLLWGEHILSWIIGGYQL